MEKTGNKFLFFMLAMALGIFMAVGTANALYNGYDPVNHPGCYDATADVTYECGDRVEASCTFNADMSCPDGINLYDGDGLIVGAHGITIDGNGYCLDGVAPGDDCDYIPGHSGIDSHGPGGGVYDGYDDVVIKNLEIKNFCTGIRINGYGGPAGDFAENNLIDCCEIHHNGSLETDSQTMGIDMSFVAFTTVSNCHIHDIIGDCAGSCPPGGMGIHLCEGDCAPGTTGDNRILNNIVEDNIMAGIFCRCGNTNTLTAYNYTTGNGFGGIRYNCVYSNGTIEYNHSTANYGPGIFIGGPENIVRYNTSTDNTNGGGHPGHPTWGIGHGLHLDRALGGIGAIDNVLEHNTLCGNNDLSDPNNPAYDLYLADARDTICTGNYLDRCLGGSAPGNPQCVCANQPACNDPGNVDTDNDGVRDNIDNCRLTANSIQRDSDLDGDGNMCDCDVDNNGIVFAGDFDILINVDWGTCGPDTDFDCNGVVSGGDYDILFQRWGQSPPFE